MIVDPILIQYPSPTGKRSLFWEAKIQYPNKNRISRYLGLTDSDGAHEWSINWEWHNPAYSIKLPALFHWQKGVTREGFIENLADNFPDHFEWFMWHPEWIGL